MLLRGALIGGEINLHSTVFVKVVRRPFREKGGERDLRALAEFIPCHAGSPRSTVVGGGVFFLDKRRRVKDESPNHRFVAISEATRAVLVVDGGACAGGIGGIATRESGDGGGEADGVAIVLRIVCGNQRIVLRAACQKQQAH